MTRFARAKGSKSSNEKVPEEATPWSQLKRGILTKQESVNEETKKCVSALKSKTEDKPAEWVSLDDESEDSLNILKEHLQKRKKAKANTDGDEEVQEKTSIVKKQKTKYIENMETSIQKKRRTDECQDNSRKLDKGEKNKKSEQGISDQIELKKFKKKKKMDVSVEQDETADSKEKKKQRIVPDGEEPDKDDIKEKIVKKKKKKKKLNNKIGNDCEDKKKMKIFAGEKSLKRESQQTNNTNKLKKSKKDKKKFNDDKMTINIGDEMVNIVKFQGFYVTNEDAERLKELQQKMTQEGIPQSQIDGAIKLERRRCEKALSRMKKNVCFHCRKPNHKLSQCPEIRESVDTTTGVCYKCGSTEHKAFSCKVTKVQKFPFAECFICKEKGHIARECPDNPRGLYPKGGCCKICGDVTHLKKDCPKRISETEEKTIKLGLMDDRNVEGLDDGGEKTVAGSEKKQEKKPVSF